jgi:hypothetical protein
MSFIDDIICRKVAVYRLFSLLLRRISALTQRNTYGTGWRVPIVVDDKQCSDGIKAVFLVHQNTGVMASKHCSHGVKALFL